MLAGHETTANSLAWAFERLLRTPAAYDRLREAVRSGRATPSDYVEATIHEAMRVRPVIPIIGRRVTVPWQLGEYALPADTPVLDQHPAAAPPRGPLPRAVRLPPRALPRRASPAPTTWIPFGGGIRRCLGATLAMAEQRVVLRAIAARTDLAAADPAPEPVRHRNVTMVPAHGTRVVLESRRAAA